MKRYHAELFCKHSNQSITGQLAYAAVFARTQEYKCTVRYYDYINVATRVEYLLIFMKKTVLIIHLTDKNIPSLWVNLKSILNQCLNKFIPSKNVRLKLTFGRSAI